MLGRRVVVRARRRRQIGQRNLHVRLDHHLDGGRVIVAVAVFARRDLAGLEVVTRLCQAVAEAVDGVVVPGPDVHFERRVRVGAQTCDVSLAARREHAGQIGPLIEPIASCRDPFLDGLDALPEGGDFLVLFLQLAQLLGQCADLRGGVVPVQARTGKSRHDHENHRGHACHGEDLREVAYDGRAFGIEEIERRRGRIALPDSQSEGRDEGRRVGRRFPQVEHRRKVQHLTGHVQSLGERLGDLGLDSRAAGQHHGLDPLAARNPHVTLETPPDFLDDRDDGLTAGRLVAGGRRRDVDDGGPAEGQSALLHDVDLGLIGRNVHQGHAAALRAAVGFDAPHVRIRPQTQPKQPDAGCLGNLLVVLDNRPLDGSDEHVLALRLVLGTGLGAVVALDGKVDDGFFGPEGQFLLGLEPYHVGEFGGPGGRRQDKRLEDGLASRDVHQDGSARQVHLAERVSDEFAQGGGVGQIEALGHVDRHGPADARAPAGRFGLNNPQVPAVEIEGTEPADLLAARQPFDLLGKRCHGHLVRSTSSGSSANGNPSRVMSRR